MCAKETNMKRGHDMNKNKNELDELFWSINEQAKREGEGSLFANSKA